MKNKYLLISAIALCAALLPMAKAYAVQAVPIGPVPPRVICLVSTNNGSFLSYNWNECAWWEAQIYWNNSISVRWYPYG